jgi:hypothetical protein
MPISQSRYRDRAWNKSAVIRLSICAGTRFASVERSNMSFPEIPCFSVLLGQVARRLRSTPYWSQSRSWFDRDIDRLASVEAKESPHNWLRIQTKVLRRDRYRCRRCDKKGDEAALIVHPIHPEASHEDGMLMLCANCRTLAMNREISASSISIFLWKLWCM